ncbi:MAG: AmmeMemoRadiSam system radical SAM enzyme [Candidatus Aenigmatarchaeota archaeon]
MKAEYGSTSFVTAKFWKKIKNKNVKCELCPRFCIIKENETGFCKVRKNINGKLYSLVYGKPTSVAIDPIEKKPLFHFFPGTYAFSIGTAGCNMSCKQCQNWEISQSAPEKTFNYDLPPKEIIEKINLFKNKQNISSIAYTYNEPSIFIEYLLDTAKLAKKAKIKNTYHSCGFINLKPLKEICKYLDAANIDLKYFSNKIYKEISLGALDPVLETIKYIHSKKIWLEITNLIIPTINDSEKMIKDMCKWIFDNIGENVPLHFSRFYPSYKLEYLPPTPIQLLERAAKIAKSTGIKFVYIGNVFGNPLENTYCPSCNKIIIERFGYEIKQINLKNGKCKFCGEKIPGVFK